MRSRGRVCKSLEPTTVSLVSPSPELEVFEFLLQRMAPQKQALARDPALTRCTGLATIQVKLAGRGLCCAVAGGLNFD